jgi:predicted PurR-regulated permease PerM
MIRRVFFGESLKFYYVSAFPRKPDLERDSMNLLRAAATVSGLTLLSRITGLAREMLTAALFGASAMTDAFFVAFRLPNMLRRLFAEGAFSQAFVPMLAQHRHREGGQDEDHARARRFIDAIASALFGALLGVTLLGTIPDALRSFSATYANLRNSNAFLSAALPVLSPALTSSTGIDPARATAVLNQLLDASLAVAPSFLGGIGVVVAVLINLGFVIFIAIFFLIDPQVYVKASLFLLPQRYHHRAIFLWNEIYRDLKLWISSLFLSIIITAGLVWLILGVVLGMPNAVVVAVFAGFATFVPNIGAFLPLIPIAIFTLADNPAQFFIMAPVYLVIQLLESNLLTPSIIKIELAIPAGAMMVFQLLATLAFGALGLLLAIPILVVLLVLVREIYTNDLLGLQQTVIKIGTNARGEFTVLEDTLPAQVAGVAAPAKPAKVFSPGAESEQVVMSSKQG